MATFQKIGAPVVNRAAAGDDYFDEDERGIGTPEQLSRIVEFRVALPALAYIAPVGARK